LYIFRHPFSGYQPLDIGNELTEKYLEGEILSDSEVLTGLQQMIQTQKASPVFFGSCALNRGISETLDLIIQLAPSSNYRGKIKVLDYADTSKEVEIAQSKDASFAGIVIKTIIDQFAGKITFLRVLSGSFKPEEDVMNCTQEKVLRFLPPLIVEREHVDELISALRPILATLSETQKKGVTA